MFVETPFNQVKEFHQHFDPIKHKGAKALTKEQAEFRSGFKLEEIIEFLYAANAGDEAGFNESINYLKETIDVEAKKVLEKKKEVEPLVDEVDGLIDLLYFTYGSFVMMDIDPTPIFNIVHQANMGKIFPDGKPHYHEVTGKVLKPDNWVKDFAPEGKIKEEITRQINEGV
ncbi:pyrophosphohydrolase domain-containing protein [Vagococcus hydrophili]|uniref:HAD family hydrolase n=1 Tax=Vagococcus hydrophili TaxID=2714947 RepID=A0A6G8AR54_9ENTE|nr:HAD family hydrolase [Vagococcus hydrophili]QIL47476.1 HAD family hydrolase [Vagococcus hydrophili]